MEHDLREEHSMSKVLRTFFTIFEISTIVLKNQVDFYILNPFLKNKFLDFRKIREFSFLFFKESTPLLEEP